MADSYYSADRCKFSLRFYNHLFTSNNFMVSPLSAEIALLMAYIGAKGKTKQEIADMLGLNARYTVENLSASFVQMKTDGMEKPYAYESKEDECYKVFMANGAFVSNHLEPCSQYTENLAKLFEARCIPLDFVNPNVAAQCINGFIEEHTKGIIRDVVSPADFSCHTSLLLANALYFKANWQRQFGEGNTGKKPFKTATGKIVQVDTMHTTQSFSYCKCKELGDARILKMPYYGEACSAYFILPGKKKGLFQKRSSDHGLSSLSKLLTPKKLLEAINNVYAITYMTVQMPKFKIEQSLDMEQVLKDMGMPTAFSEPDADFSGISPCSMKISKVRQKAYIEVNEKGTEAAAATVVILENCCLPRNTKGKFIANRPFLFFIRHDASSTILFMGHVSDPSSP